MQRTIGPGSRVPNCTGMAFQRLFALTGSQPDFCWRISACLPAHVAVLIARIAESGEMEGLVLWWTIESFHDSNKPPT